MTLTQLEIFTMVAELRGFTAAALRLGISQSAVSHALKALERELGQALVERRQGQVALTELGARLLPRAREMLGLAETLRQEAADARGLRRGTLRIGSFGPTSSLRLLPRILQAYRRDYPGIEVRIDESSDQEVMQWIQERRVDLGFVVLPEEHFATYPLVEDQMVALLPVDSPLAKHPSVNLNELCAAPFILTEAGSAQLITRLFAAANLSPNIRYRSSQVMTTLAMVARGDGVALLAELALPPLDAGAASYLVKPLRPRQKRSVGLAMHNARQASPAALAFVQTALTLKKRGQLV